MKADANFYLNANCDLTSQKEQLEDQLATALSDADKLKELIRCQQDDVKREHERAQELEIQLHQLQTEAGGEMAPRGNSLFAEVSIAQFLKYFFFIFIYFLRSLMAKSAWKRNSLCCINKIDSCATR